MFDERISEACIVSHVGGAKIPGRVLGKGGKWGGREIDVQHLINVFCDVCEIFAHAYGTQTDRTGRSDDALPDVS
jgi:hypothetical protein